MPAGPGESLVTTVFADVHYYFSDPSTKPQHHRFDRGSYVYLFHNAAEHRAKLEVANHAGTADQDAFSGYLDVARVSYSYKQPSLFTVAIDGAAMQGHEQWHLPSYDEFNEQKYLYKIHTLDIYLWTEKDGTAFLQQLRSVLPAAKLDVRDMPPNAPKPAEHQDSMSTVVQQLERTAVSPQFTPQRQESTASKHSLPGSQHTASPAPMAYNPAAPAAPEPIAHREKTPPPPDANSGTGLTNASRYDSVPQQQYGNVPNTFGGPPSQPSQQPNYFSGPPQQQRTPSFNSFAGPPQATPTGIAHRSHAGSLPPPPPQAGGAASPIPYAPSFAGPPTQAQTSHLPSPPPSQHSSSRQSSLSMPTQQYANYSQHSQRTPSFGPGAVASPGLPTPQQQPPTPSAPPAYTPGQLGSQHNPHDYSNYNYDAAQQAQQYNQHGGYAGDVHQQAYKPTAEEAAGHHGKPKDPKKEAPSRMESRVTNVEAKVGKFMKRLDRLI